MCDSSPVRDSSSLSLSESYLLLKEATWSTYLDGDFSSITALLLSGISVFGIISTSNKGNSSKKSKLDASWDNGTTISVLFSIFLIASLLVISILDIGVSPGLRKNRK